MEKIILDKIKNIPSYQYDENNSSFVTNQKSTIHMLQDLVDIANILSENNIQFAIDEKYCVNVNVIDAEPQEAFVVSLDREAKIIDINDVALELSGYKREDLIGSSWFDLFISNADKESLNKVFLDVLSGKNNYWKHQNNIILKDGSSKLLHWSNALIKDKENNISTIHAFGVV